MPQVPGGTPATEQHADVSDTSVGELMTNVMKDLSTLVRQEVELAKAEMKAEAGKAAKGAGMLGGAGFAGYMVLLFLSLALWWGLANVMDQGWAALIVAAVWTVIGVVLYTTGRSAIRRVSPKPEQTIDTLQQVPAAVKGERP
ncbi:phage holin family protein [Amycolatopsis sp. cmx-11-51]|uniref:phage holin family protein n=1 Tax=unclassified Amycolatopsis TaxID=2618356 RepID=UPI0039E3D073